MSRTTSTVGFYLPVAADKRVAAWVMTTPSAKPIKNSVQYEGRRVRFDVSPVWFHEAEMRREVKVVHSGDSAEGDLAGQFEYDGQMYEVYML